MAILDLITQAHLPSSVNMLPKYLKHFTFSSSFWSIVIVTGDGCLKILLSIFISISLHVSGNYVPIIRRTFCIYATLVFCTLYVQSAKYQCRIDTLSYPDDGYIVAQNI